MEYEKINTERKRVSVVCLDDRQGWNDKIAKIKEIENYLHENVGLMGTDWWWVTTYTVRIPVGAGATSFVLKYGLGSNEETNDS